MKKYLCIILALFLLTGCVFQDMPSGSAGQAEDTAAQDSADTQQNTGKNEEQEDMVMRMKINDTLTEVDWQENETVQALMKMVQEEPLVIQMSMYGGFEQVGPIGTELPHQDSQTVTESGDIVLYSGNQIVVFYGSNSWAYTRLGHIKYQSEMEMRSLLSDGDVTVTIFTEKAK